MFQIRDLVVKSDLIIAPMASITNNAFIELCFELGAGIVVKEMVSDKALIYDNERTLEMIKEPDNKTGLVGIQVFGNEIDSMVKACKILDQTNYDFIDINMGCPVNKIVKQGSGSALMLDEDKAFNLVKSIVEAVKKPVTVKLRSGYYSHTPNYLSLALKLEKAGASMITLHARSKTQMYQGHADWNQIKELKKHLKIPVIGNGDIKTLDDYLQAKEFSQVDGIMIGRGIVGNPFLIKQIINYQNNFQTQKIEVKDIMQTMLNHAQKLINLRGEEVAMAQFRKISPNYFSGLKNGSKFRAKLTKVESYEQLKMIVDEYLEFC